VHQIFITMTIKSLINLILTTKALLSFMVMYPTNRLRTVINYLLFMVIRNIYQKSEQPWDILS